MRVHLYGGSFNPPHLGHASVAQFLLNQPDCDALWLVPTFSHAFHKDLAPFSDRVEMLKELKRDLKNPEKLSICEEEAELNQSPSYTITLIQHLQKKYPGNEWIFWVGSDVYQNLSQWHQIDDLKKIIKIRKLARKGYADPEDSIHPEVSSSEIRDKLKQGQAIRHLVTQSVADYLETHKLYP